MAGSSATLPADHFLFILSRETVGKRDPSYTANLAFLEALERILEKKPQRRTVKTGPAHRRSDRAGDSVEIAVMIAVAAMVGFGLWKALTGFGQTTIF